MLTIRDAQRTLLRDSQLGLFANDAIDHLLTHFPGPSAALGGPPAVREFVDLGIFKAKGSGVDTHGAVLVLLELWIQFGLDFERSPFRAFSNNVLAHRELPGTAKADMIRDRHMALTEGCVVVPQ